MGGTNNDFHSRSKIVGERIGADIVITITATPAWFHATLKELAGKGMTCELYRRLKSAVDQLEQNRVEV